MCTWSNLLFCPLSSYLVPLFVLRLYIAPSVVRVGSCVEYCVCMPVWVYTGTVSCTAQCVWPYIYSLLISFWSCIAPRPSHLSRYYTTVWMVSKWAGWASIGAMASSRKKGLLFVWEKISQRRFLVDTGAEASVFPAIRMIIPTAQPGASVVAANGSTIWMFRVCTILLHFALKEYKWD